MNRPRFQRTSFSSGDILRLGILGMAWLVVLGLVILRFGPKPSVEMMEGGGLASVQPAPSPMTKKPIQPAEPLVSSTVWYDEGDEVADRAIEAPGTDEGLRAAAMPPSVSPGPMEEAPLAATLPLNEALHSLTQRIADELRSGNERLDEAARGELRIVVDRMNRAGVPVVINVYDSPVDAARRLAVKVEALFVETGLDSSLLEVLGRDDATEAGVELVAGVSIPNV